MSFTTQNQRTMKIDSFVSDVCIKYKTGVFEVCDQGKPVTKHGSLAEAQWMKSIIDRARCPEEKTKYQVEQGTQSRFFL